jgi:hypothetical protein
MTRLTSAMGFDPSRCKMTAEEKKANSRARAEGARKRKAVLDYLLECLTSPDNPTDIEQLNEFKMTSWHFPDIKQAIDKVERVFDDKEDLRKAIMLAAAYEIIERLMR